MKASRIEMRRRPKLPPILDIDEDGLPGDNIWGGSMCASNEDGDVNAVQMGDWPMDLDD